MLLIIGEQFSGYSYALEIRETVNITVQEGVIFHFVHKNSVQ
jgi:hypothetical protein